jgi:hypothetical protein
MKRFGNFLIPLLDAVLAIGKSDLFFVRNDKEDLTWLSLGSLGYFRLIGLGPVIRRYSPQVIPAMCNQRQK